MTRLLSGVLLGVLLTMAGGVLAAYQKGGLPGFAHWTAAELRGYEQPLHDKVSGPLKTSSVSLADYGSSNVAISHREADGKPEVHAHMDDYFVVESGEAELQIGGEVVNPTTPEPNETRGDGLKGAEKRRLLPGDIVHIPASMPHQLLVPGGKRFTYFVIKVRVK